jgi:hypothetical protein
MLPDTLGLPAGLRMPGFQLSPRAEWEALEPANLVPISATARVAAIFIDGMLWVRIT